jgi:hypothetical protein
LVTRLAAAGNLVSGVLPQKNVVHAVTLSLCLLRDRIIRNIVYDRGLSNCWRCGLVVLIDNLLHGRSAARCQELHARHHGRLLRFLFFGVVHTLLLDLHQQPFPVRCEIIVLWRGWRRRWWRLLQMVDEIIQICSGNLRRDRQILNVVLESLFFVMANR